MPGPVQFWVKVFLVPALVCLASPIADDSSRHRSRREAPKTPSLQTRVNCGPGDPQPPTRVNTTKRLEDMRQAMTSLSIYAFIVLSDDAHGSEYPADSEKRRGFISGFSGSAGTAVVTMDKAALWTDGRYFEEAENALDCNWIFMKQGEAEVPSVNEWLIGEMKNRTGEKIGADPFLVSNSIWQSSLTAFNKANITFIEVTNNPVDTAWKSHYEQQPPLPQSNVTMLDIKFAGKTWQDKIDDLRRKMSKKEAAAFIVTSLDETAWLFNLRGNDIEYNPFFLSYAIIQHNRIRLYILDKERRLNMDPPDAESHSKLYVHLNTSVSGNCTVYNTEKCVEVLDYNRTRVIEDMKAIASASSRNKIWITFSCNYAIFSAIPEVQRIQDKSSIALDKSMKNEVERKGMENCQIRDSLVLIEFLAMLDKEVKENRNWTEVSAAEKLNEMRSKAQYNRGLSFETISASGENGAIIHYRPLAVTNRKITTTEMYLLDSGGQYLDGTTDVTRTMHYGNPKEFEKECYTRVLMGAIDLALVVWPQGLYGREIDMAARGPLWSLGLEYNHGTGHGIGSYLSVHEGPGRISLSHSSNPSEETLREYMFFSDEPGFYATNQFGIRLETIVMVEPYKTQYNISSKQFFSFKPFTLVPFEPNLIKYDLLSTRQIEWLNSYHKRVWDTMYGKQNLSQNALKWLEARTKPYGIVTFSLSNAPQITITTIMLAALIAVLSGRL